jgi:hypothetical protein
LKQHEAAVPLMVGHRLLGISLLSVGDIAQGRAHFDRAFRLYDPAAHRPLVTRFGIDTGVSVLCYRPLALWLLGYPEANFTAGLELNQVAKHLAEGRPSGPA